MKGKMNAHIVKRNKESFKFLKFSNPSFIGENGILDFNSPYQFRSGSNTKLYCLTLSIKDLK